VSIKKKGITPVLAHLLVFVVIFSLFLSSYYIFYPYISKMKSKSEIKKVENDLIELTEKLSIVIERKNKQFLSLLVDKGKITLLPYKNFIIYEIEVPYSPYYYSWYDILNNRPMPIDMCEESNNKLVNCTVEKLGANCIKKSNFLYSCYFPALNNITVDYLLVDKYEITQDQTDKGKVVFINTKPVLRVVKDAPPCSLYVNVEYSQKKEKLTYYIVCNIKKKRETCIIPVLTGNLVATPVVKTNIVINYKKEEYVPNFNYYNCKDAYLRYIEIKTIRR